ncbi:uracil-DNA glycosylase [Martelella alba]|uniref:Uracil-DNA glycosylase n=1 Tax=Martelella alba TaxID=2590451 RepID=A0A506U4W8_9HYPH|nr:uracil-DNA glycosylase [Martelella alba]TPW29422.1 uracil-DNA glycosylase [Martelella alba]
MMTAEQLAAEELAALMHFYADSGVDILCEDLPVDLTALKPEQPAPAAPRHRQVPPARQPEATEAQRPPAPQRAAPQGSAASAIPSDPATIPDDRAIADARFAAESARSLGELKQALSSFASCNLRHNARSTICLDAAAPSGIMMICGFPNGDDDRAGAALSGRAGQLFDAMLAAIGLSRENIALTTAIPWRTPGDRSPTMSEAEICRPFIERQIALAEPKHLLLLGNFASRLLIDRDKTVFDLRGELRDITIGSMKFRALATLAPSELLAAPTNKKLAWRDLQRFQSEIA